MNEECITEIVDAIEQRLFKILDGSIQDPKQQKFLTVPDGQEDGTENAKELIKAFSKKIKESLIRALNEGRLAGYQWNKMEKLFRRTCNEVKNAHDKHTGKTEYQTRLSGTVRHFVMACLDNRHISFCGEQRPHEPVSLPESASKESEILNERRQEIVSAFGEFALGFFFYKKINTKKYT